MAGKHGGGDAKDTKAKPDNPHRLIGRIRRTDALALVLLVFAIQAEVFGHAWQIVVAALVLMTAAAVLPVIEDLKFPTPLGDVHAKPKTELSFSGPADAPTALPPAPVDEPQKAEAQRSRQS